MLADTRSLHPAAGSLAVSAYLEAALDCVVIADANGCVVEFNPAAERTFGYSREQVLGRKLAELIVPEALRQRHSEAFERFAATGEGELFGQRLSFTGMRADGSEFPVELALSRVGGEPLLVCGVLRDLTDPKRAEEDLRRHAAEHAALRRVATLIASEAHPADVFAAVAREVAFTLEVPLTAVIRFEADGAAIQVGAWGEENPFPVGTSWPLDEQSVSGQVARTGRPAHVDDYSAIPGAIASRLAREAGIHTAVGVPILVEGSLWGAMMALSTAEQPLAQGVDARLSAFTELIATAIANTQARDDLRRLADEQAALRRVATLVAKGATPDEVFAAVAEEVARVLDVPAISMVRFERDETSTAIAVWGDGNPFGVGATFVPWPGVMLQVRETGLPARLEDFAYSTGPTTARLQAARIHSGVGVPVTVEGRVWGTIIALAPGGGSLSAGIAERLSSFTDLVATAIANTEARDDLRQLAEEQAALRRVALLVAEEASQHEVFAGVAREASRVLDDALIEIVRCDPDRRATVVGAWGEHPFEVGSQWTLDGPSVIASVLDTGAPARIDDFSELPGSLAAAAREAGLRSVVGAPIAVDGRTWGVVLVISREAQPLPPGTEVRLASFSELAATAISRTEARDALRKSEELYRRAIAEAGAVPYVLDYATGTYSFIGEGIEELTGYRPDELDHEVFGSLVLETFLHGEQARLDETDAAYRTRAGEFKRWRSDLRIERRDGEIRWLSDASVEILGDHGPSVGSIGMLQDITERMQTDEERLRLAAILEATTDVVTLMRPDGRVLYVNRAGRQLLQLSAEEDVSALTISDLQPPAAQAQVIQEGIPTATREGAWSGEGALLSSGGREIPVSQVILAHKDAHGEVTFLSAIARDLSERLELEGRLRRTQDEQSALRRVATLVAQEAEPAAVFDAVAAEVARLFEVEMTSILRYEPDGVGVKVGGSGRNNPFPVGARLTPSAGVIPEVWRTGRSTRVDDYHRLEDSVAERLSGAGIRSSVGVPIVVNGATWGTMVVLSADPARLAPGTEERLARFTELVATAIANAQARDELRRLANEQAALQRVATLVAEGAPAPEVFAAVAREVAEVSGLPLVEMGRFDPDGWLTVIGSAGDHPLQTGTRWPMDNPTGSAAIRETRRATRIEYTDDLPGTVAEAIRSFGVRWAVGVPIVVDGTAWGSIGASAADGGPPPPDAEERLIGFAELVSTAISNAQARDELRDIADEQAALRRVATLVAEGAGSPAVYDAICQETGPVIGATSVNLCHFTADRCNLTMAGWSLHDTHIPTGTRLPIEGGTINELVFESGAPARIESYAEAEGALADLIRERGIKSEVAAPVSVDGRLWGCLIAGWDSDEAPPAGAERRLAGFAELVATAVSNALTRSELVASRARIVTAADEARRNIERNLHDGVQQQLVALELELKTVETGIPPQLEPARHDLERLQAALEDVLEDVREISHGVHPATLSQWGLGPALRTLTRRSPIPVELEIDVPDRLPDSVEIATYYVVSEALANVTKHAEASYVIVEVTLADDWLQASVRDDGIGGADTARGSGLRGLVDRVEALGGRLSLASAPQQGTTVTAALPIGLAPADGR